MLTVYQRNIFPDTKHLPRICILLGGWAGGNASKDLAKNAELMWKQSVWSSAISATISSHFLKSGGVLTLTGADAALDGTPGMIGYGLAKGAVHQLTKSLAQEKSGLPENSLVVSILPITLDTPMVIYMYKFIHSFRSWRCIIINYYHTFIYHICSRRIVNGCQKQIFLHGHHLISLQSK